MGFKKAKRGVRPLRAAFVGPTGSGKTYSALRVASAFGARIGLIDTERESASLYAGQFDFDTLDLRNYAPQDYIAAIKEANQERFDVLIIDSLTHAWAGPGGALDMADQAQAKSKNKFAAWRDVTPWHNRLVDALLDCPSHLIVTMRAKMAYEVSKDAKGRTSVEKLGLAPIQRDGLTYEFDLVADFTQQHQMMVDKTRFSDLDGLAMHEPDEEFGARLRDLVVAGVAPGEARATPPQDKPTYREPQRKGTDASIEAAGGPSATIIETLREGLLNQLRGETKRLGLERVTEEARTLLNRSGSWTLDRLPELDTEALELLLSELQQTSPQMGGAA